MKTIISAIVALISLLFILLSFRGIEDCRICPTTATEAILDTTGKTEGDLPVYVPGSIRLEPIDPEHNEFAFTPTKRRVYYMIPGSFFEFGDPSILETPLDEKAKEPQEMALVTFIRHYKVKREDFDKAVEERRALNVRLGNDMTNEWYELPNADIIYTFDNDIINEYYRRA